MNMVCIASILVVALPMAGAQYGDPGQLRQIVDRTQSDLRAGAELSTDHKQHERVAEAQKHLSDFDRHLTKGKFKKSELDQSIGGIKSVLDHNTLQPSTRDAVTRDMEDLRVARARDGR